MLPTSSNVGLLCQILLGKVDREYATRTFNYERYRVGFDWGDQSQLSVGFITMDGAMAHISVARGVP